MVEKERGIGRQMEGSLSWAAGAISFSFAASSSFSTAVAKERPPPEFIPKELVLYQYEACPFCNKVKAFLDYYDLPYKIVEVNPISKKEIKWSDYKKVPILVVDGKQLNDSSAIINDLDKQIHSNKERLLTKDTEEDEKWRRWVDEHLVHVLSPNIYRSASEALESFDYITTNGNFTTLERLTGKYVGAAAMYFVSKKLKKKYNITDERASLYEAADTWVRALNNKTFMGGSQPNLADLAVFGVLRPIRFLQSGKDMIANTNIGPCCDQEREQLQLSCIQAPGSNPILGQVVIFDVALLSTCVEAKTDGDLTVDLILEETTGAELEKMDGRNDSPTVEQNLDTLNKKEAANFEALMIDSLINDLEWKYEEWEKMTMQVNSNGATKVANPLPKNVTVLTESPGKVDIIASMEGDVGWISVKKKKSHVVHPTFTRSQGRKF
ncbi:hypothetical protein KI387_011006 [Taxus chinensis]|uniref:Prostaglandin E synthase 2 n=1 Tax=Taxus chinensis TaxID=29808 RepID=A0AA38FLQ9_TAXCH|nr:hypothetical protein KI387_011006 [Taxus chinensis]